MDNGNIKFIDYKKNQLINLNIDFIIIFESDPFSKNCIEIYIEEARVIREVNRKINNLNKA